MFIIINYKKNLRVKNETVQITKTFALLFFRGVTMSITEVIGMILPFIVLTVWVVIDYIRRNK